MQLELVIVEGVKKEVQWRKKVKKIIFFNFKIIIILNKGSSKSKLVSSVVGASKGSRRSGAMVATSKSFVNCFLNKLLNLNLFKDFSMRM